MNNDLEALWEYWRSPTGVALAPPGMVELARLNVNQLADEIERLRTALAFYADPNTYFAIGFLPDPPCGAFIDDWSEHGGTDFEPGDERPGKRAREVLA